MPAICSVGHNSYVQIYACPMQCGARVPSVGHYEQELPGTQSSPGGGLCGRVTAVPLRLSTGSVNNAPAVVLVTKLVTN